MAEPLRKPPPRLVESVRPQLAGAEPQYMFVAQVGGNPALAIAALPIGIITLFLPTGTIAGVMIASALSLAFVIWVLAVFLPMKSRVVAVTGEEIVVFDASKLRFEPKKVVRRLPRSHRFGALKGFLTAKVDLGEGERGWVFKGYGRTIDAIDGRYVETVPLGGGLPPRQRWADRVRRKN